MMIVRRVVASALSDLRSGCRLAVAVWPVLGPCWLIGVQEAYAKLGDESCDHVADLREC
jgi:hypothetical protein